MKVAHLALFAVTMCVVGCVFYLSTPSIKTSYWIWAGITAQDVPPNSELYIYQGLITHKDDATTYQRIGLYPHPLKAREIFLVYRLEGALPDPNTVVSVFANSVAQWQRHPLVVSGLQLDFDSPTAKLLVYSQFLQKIRQTLPKSYALSVTGLGDWAINGDKQAVSAIVKSVDELVFQLYQGRKPIPYVDSYVEALGHYPLPFRVGLLAADTGTDYIQYLKRNPNFKGVIYFVQGHHEAVGCLPRLWSYSAC